MLVVLVNAASVHRNQLQVNYEIMQDVCFSPVLVFVGTLCTTFSSALRCAEAFNHPHFNRFFSIFSRFPRGFWPCSLDSWRPDGENGRKMGENG